MLGTHTGAGFTCSFVGRLDDEGQDGREAAADIGRMFEEYGSKMMVLAARRSGVRNLLNSSFPSSRGSSLVNSNPFSLILSHSESRYRNGAINHLKRWIRF